MQEVSDQQREFCARGAIPLPSGPPREQLRRLLLFRNSLHLENSSCALSGKDILSAIPAAAGLKVYDVEQWLGDGWDPLAYGKAYDFERPFFEQLRELMLAVPFPNLGVVASTMENSSYTNDITSARNCYLLFGATDNEDCMFSQWMWRCRDCLDCVYAFDSELCFECSDIRSCYNIKFSEHCENCRNSSFLLDCRGCSDCYGCVGLERASFCFFNQQLSSEDYRCKLAEINLGSFKEYSSQQANFQTFRSGFPLRHSYGRSNENSSGNFLYNTKNCFDSYFVSNSQDTINCLGLDNAKSSILQASYGDDSELVYLSTGIGDNAYNVKFSWECWCNVSDLEYCMYCTQGASNCFGCIGVRRASCCILNKQYSEREYEELLPRVKAHMTANAEYGEFFPARFSPHAYNRSWAQQFLPLQAEECRILGFRWHEQNEACPRGEAELPDTAEEVRETDLEKVLRCSITGKPYRITKRELEYYQRNALPLPRQAPLERIKLKHKLFWLP